MFLKNSHPSIHQRQNGIRRGSLSRCSGFLECGCLPAGVCWERECWRSAWQAMSRTHVNKGVPRWTLNKIRASSPRNNGHCLSLFFFTSTYGHWTFASHNCKTERNWVFAVCLFFKVKPWQTPSLQIIHGPTDKLTLCLVNSQEAAGLLP